MAARLTDKQKKKIIADYVEMGSFNAAAKANGVSRNTVKRLSWQIVKYCRKPHKKRSRILLICLHTWRNGKKMRKVS